MLRIETSRLKDRWRAGEAAIGSLTLIPEPAMCEVVGASGLDFMVVDMEHTSAFGRVVENMIRGCQAAKITPIVRVRDTDPKTLGWVLDSGADGILIPLLEDPEIARRTAELCRYPTATDPTGRRTLCSGSRSAGWGSYRDDFDSFVEHVNEEISLLALLETPEACERVDELAATPVDAFMMGRADLSLKLGSYDPMRPDVIELCERTLTKVMDAGKVAGVLAYNLEDAQRWLSFGCKFIIYSQPELLLAAVYTQAERALRGIPKSSLAGSASAHGVVG
jgi:2-keto-3-deoxy-L-rhamnonate aldolase RhmA